ncbi:hypothetical protein MAR_005537 [Mya arenaria]|uniref:Uncharacterized protein n=1 Tax=Mya arenaria TaxID=6604 RepID=A0ABY7F2Z2_MYAAR|nr:uncharacterized protein LOC128245395 [Mya arenaria]WAR15432.1 hypothetical protein MAR_005537 [Mya arenaria]
MDEMILHVNKWTSLVVLSCILTLPTTLGQATAGSHPMLASLFNVANNMQLINQQGQQGGAHVQPMRPNFSTPPPRLADPTNNLHQIIPGFPQAVPVHKRPGTHHTGISTGADKPHLPGFQQQPTWSVLSGQHDTKKIIGVSQETNGGPQVGKLPDITDGHRPVIADAADMMCGLCMQTNNYTCIQKWCMQTNGPSASESVLIDSNTNDLRQNIPTNPSFVGNVADSNVNVQALDFANNGPAGILDVLKKHPLLGAGFSMTGAGQSQPNVAVLPSLGNDQVVFQNNGPISGLPVVPETAISGTHSVDSFPAKLPPITPPIDNIHNQGSGSGFERPIEPSQGVGIPAAPFSPNNDIPNQGNEFGFGTSLEPIPTPINPRPEDIPLGPIQLGAVEMPAPGVPDIRDVPQANNVFEQGNIENQIQLLQPPTGQSNQGPNPSDSAAANQLFDALQNDINVFNTAPVGTPNEEIPPPFRTTPIEIGSTGGGASSPDGGVISANGPPKEVPMNMANDVNNIDFHESFRRFLALQNVQLWNTMQEFDLKSFNNEGLPAQVNNGMQLADVDFPQVSNVVDSRPVNTGNMQGIASSGTATMQARQDVAMGGSMPTGAQQFPAGFVEDFPTTTPWPTLPTMDPVRKSELQAFSGNFLRGIVGRTT